MAYALENGYKVEDYTLSFCNYHDGSSNIRFFENYNELHFFEYPKPRFKLLNRIKWKLKRFSNKGAHVVENFENTYDLSSLSKFSKIELKGFHFCSHELINKHRNKILEILSFNKNFTKPIKLQLLSFRRSFKILLGVHIRLNDFKEFYDGKFYHESSVYIENIKKFISFFKNPSSVGVVICSDDLSVLDQFSIFKPLTPKGNVVEDMYALSQCDYILSTQKTTMSSWAAFYNNIPIFKILPSHLPEKLDDYKIQDSLNS